MSSHVQERGRDNDKVPTGRGGAGNMVRSPSRGRPAPEAGEEAAQRAYAEKQQHLHSGRGGAGNLRSPSRDPADRARVREAEREEKELRDAAIKKNEHAPHGTGRGGSGNVLRDHSADASRGRDGGKVGEALRSLSRSRSRDARSSTARGSEGASGPGLASVNETTSSHDGASTNTATTKSSGGVFNKIASHLPGHSK